MHAKAHIESDKGYEYEQKVKSLAHGYILKVTLALGSDWASFLCIYTYCAVIVFSAHAIHSLLQTEKVAIDDYVNVFTLNIHRLISAEQNNPH